MTFINHEACSWFYYFDKFKRCKRLLTDKRIALSYYFYKRREKMELGKQIKKLRHEKSLSQEKLAEMVYVSRQTISNWENDKSYPDIHSLLLLSQVLDVAIDQLIKGDIEMMKEQINQDDIRKFGHLSNIFAIMMLATIITPIPLVQYLSYVGLGIWLLIFAFTFYVSILAEKEKKRLNIQTYKEILTFMEGKQLDKINQAREEGKRPYQKIIYAFVVGIITLIINLLILLLLR